MPYRTIMVRTEGLGDVVMLVPLLRELSRKYPHSAVDLVTNSAVAAQLLGPERLVRRALTRPENLRSIAGLRFVAGTALRYDAVIQTWNSHPFAYGRVVLMLVSGAKRRVGSSPGGKPVPGYTDVIPFDPELHMVVGNIRLGQVLFPELRVEPPRLHVTEPERAFLDDFLGHEKVNSGEILGIHPGSGRGNLVKRWETSKFAAIAQKALSNGLARRVWVFLGPDERDLAEHFRGSAEITIVTGHGIRQVAVLSSACKLLLTGDSGVGHVAAAMGVPTVTVIGPGNEKRIAPFGEGHVVVTADVPCRPCTDKLLYKNCPYDKRCLTEVTVNQVEEAVADTLRRRGP